MDFEKLLQFMVKEKGSDLFITEGVPPSIKINGKILPVGKTPLTGERCLKLIHSIMSADQIKEFERTHECQFVINNNSYTTRFRVSAFIQRGNAGMVLRKIETEIPTTAELHLPPILNNIAMQKRGIVLIVGGAGTGKSTTMASMIGFRNANSRGHIITLEDPIEFMHSHKKCIVTQREVGIDTESFETGLKNSLRQSPDVICIGEIRSREVMNYAIQYAETGHLVFATLHANSSIQAIDRIVNFFDSDRHNQLHMDLSLNLRAVVAQQLVPTIDGKSRRVAVEVMLNTPLISDYIRKSQLNEIRPQMSQSQERGMQTLDQALYDLFEEGHISYQSAIQFAESSNDLRLKIKLESKHAETLNINTDDNFTINYTR